MRAGSPKWAKFLAVLVGMAVLPLSARAQPVPAEEGLQISGPVLMVADLERSLKFYIQGLGMTVASRLSGNPGPGAVVVGPGQRPPPFILLRQRAPEAVASPSVDIGNGLSRIMLGVHYPTDVVGGWAFGLLWVLLALPWAERLANPRDRD